MDTAMESNTNGKRARANAQKTSSQRTSALQDARFAASVLLASLPATIKSLAESLLDKFLKLRIELYNFEKKQIKIGQGGLPSHLDTLQIRFEVIIEGLGACQYRIRDPREQLPS